MKSDGNMYCDHYEAPVEPSRVTINAPEGTYVFERGEFIPVELRERVNKALDEGRATVTFS